MVGKGLPVVSPEWLVNCKRTGRLLDPWEHLLTDVESEAKFQMKIEESLSKAVAHPILQGYNIFVTKNVEPSPEEMKVIILSCGGLFLAQAPNVWPANSFVISCEKDENDWKTFKGVAVMSAEWLLSGVMRQQLENVKFVLKKKNKKVTFNC